MNYVRYELECLHCKTKIVLVSVESNPIILQCPGCKKIMVLQNNRVYMVSRKFFRGLRKKYNFKYCGEITYSSIKRYDKENSDRYNNIKKEPINSKDIKKLRNFLDNCSDSKEIIEKFW